MAADQKDRRRAGAVVPKLGTRTKLVESVSGTMSSCIIAVTLSSSLSICCHVAGGPADVSSSSSSSSEEEEAEEVAGGAAKSDAAAEAEGGRQARLNAL
eukprot:COSAG04_NODE_22970_length_346_cov_0.757085_1_plen_99_part_00